MKFKLKMIAFVLLVIFVSSNNAEYAYSYGAVAENNQITEDESTINSNIKLINLLLNSNYSNTYTDLKIDRYYKIYNSYTQMNEYVYPLFDNGNCVLVGLADELGNVTLTENVCTYNDMIQSDEEVHYISEIINISENETYGSSNMQSNVNVYGGVTSQSVTTTLNTVYALSASNASSSLTTLSCDITSFVKQGSYELCWAACIAMIYNYKYTQSLTAQNVANIVGIGYNSGASLTQIVSALGRFGFSYTGYSYRMSFSKMKSSI